jgi:hypothetical protein
MQCSEFLILSSEFRDGRSGGSLEGEWEAHLAACPRCRRYQDALEKGVDLLRSLPSLDVPDDFQPRLSHRIYHIEDGASIARETLGSGATTLSVVGVAVLLAFAAWTPRAGIVGPSLELPAVVVDTPPARSFTPGPRRSTFPRSSSFFTTADFQDGPWGDTHQVLFEYSSLSGRHRNPAISRMGVQ